MVVFQSTCLRQLRAKEPALVQRLKFERVLGVIPISQSQCQRQIEGQKDKHLPVGVREVLMS